MTKDEALRLALEVLADLGMKHYENTGEVLYKNTYTAIKAALEAKVEPVAWISPTELLVMRGNALGGAKDWRVNVGLKPEDGDVGLYTAPQQRTWVGLTDEEMDAVINGCPKYHGRFSTKDPDGKLNYYELVRAVEAAHGITGENT